MNCTKSGLILAGLIAISAILHGETTSSAPPEISLPAPETWINHVHRDLMPFWMTPDAIGDPVGRFPTFRYPDGGIPAASDPAPWTNGAETLAEANPQLAVLLGRNYTRMVSHQTFAYGAAFHLTGETMYLELCRAGTEEIFSRFDPETGFASWVTDSGPDPEWKQRNSQDLAYALLGPTFYYYLTRDPATFAKIEAAVDFIMSQYGDREDGKFRWVLADHEDLGEHHSSQSEELVALLDQTNAYLLLLAKNAPEPRRSEWRVRLRLMAMALVVHFYDEERNLFWGRVDDNSFRQYGQRHVDFGHTAKTFWMLNRIAAEIGDEVLLNWVATKVPGFLQKAWLEDIGGWGESWADGDIPINRNRVWWTYAELNKLTATTAMKQPSMLAYLVRSYPYWLTEMVDPDFGEILSSRNDGERRPTLFKAHQWKNGYHSLEQALVAYITTAFIDDRPAELYFSMIDDADLRRTQPYFFAGKVTAIRWLPQSSPLAAPRQVVTFKRSE